jgi:hypothetical protein
MLLIAQDGEHFFFDFKVMGYPRIDDAVLRDILAPKIRAGEVPYRKWVCISDASALYDRLSYGEETDNWQAIVNKLGIPPIQFAGDAFWRIKGPFIGNSGKLVASSLVEQIQQEGVTTKVRQIRTLYKINEKDTFHFEIVKHSPRADMQSLESPISHQQIDIKTTSNGPIKLQGNPQISLRPYTGFSVNFETARSEELDERDDTIGFVTNPPPSPGAWPTGPDVTVTVRVAKKRAVIYLHMLFVVLGAILFFIGGKMYDDYHVGGAVLAAAGVLCILYAYILGKNQLPTKI